jgi:plastocyanin
MRKSLDQRTGNEQIVMLILAILLCVTALWAIGCGGGASYSAPTSPSTSTPAASTPAPSTPAPSTTPSVTVSIVGITGSGAFNPNPVQATSGNIVWTNNTSVTHVLVMNDGRSIGTVNPGASVTMAVGAGGDYHCTNHPSMVGSVNGTAAPMPPSGTSSDY